MLRSSKLVFLSAAKDLGRRPKNRHSSALSAMSETPAPTSVSSAPSPDPKFKPAGSNARTAPRPDRMSRRQDLPRLKSEAQTIRVMVEEFCSYHHGTSGHMLCPKCQAFLDYALKRLACCPYGEDKPVCGSCKIHCYKPAERETARQVMRWAGPRLIFSHPLMAVSHVVDKLVHKAPDKPRNTARAKPAMKPAAHQTPSPSLPPKNNNKSK